MKPLPFIRRSTFPVLVTLSIALIAGASAGGQTSTPIAASQAPPAAPVPPQDPPNPATVRRNGRPADNNRIGTSDERITIEIGHPSVWSMAQAHYLLANLHLRNRDLEVKMPTGDDLDPSRANAARLEILQQLLAIEGQFDQGMGVRNRMKAQQYRRNLRERRAANQQLEDRQRARDEVSREIRDLRLQVADLEEKRRQMAADRVAADPDATAESPEEKALAAQIATLNEKVKLKEERRDQLDEDIDALHGEATADVDAPEFEEPELEVANSATLPESQALTDFTTKALESFNSPSLAAAVRLDNFIGMQYEIIAKQLTLLRDEIGPDERVIFLELPASIYTVDRRANGYLAQVEWEVEAYYDTVDEQKQLQLLFEAAERGDDIAKYAFEVRINALLEAGGTKAKELLKWFEEVYLPTRGPGFAESTRLRIQRAQLQLLFEAAERGDDIAEDAFEAQINALLEAGDTKAKGLLKWFEEVYLPTRSTDFAESTHLRIQKPKSVVQPEVKQVRPERSPKTTVEDRGIWWSSGEDEPGKTERGQSLPVTLDVIDTTAANTRVITSPLDHNSDDVRPLKVRTLDIIPRQGALNVNENTAKLSSNVFFGAFKFLLGFTGGVSFQRQKEEYAQFLNQELFAAGYGKGDNLWGWTFGPLPGTARLNPGIRTTYAVLAVPREALALKLTGRARAFRQGEEPDDADGDRSATTSFMIRVPSERTETFWTTGVSYYPVRSGNPVTVVIDGRSFSPQLGLLVNGIPLKPRVSLAGRAIREFTTSPLTGDVKGEYEILNSGQIIATFSMPAGYVGTPEITIVSPEKSASINSFRLVVNHKTATPRRLREVALTEPMFVEDFALKGAEVLSSSATKVEIRIHGRGLRPNARIWANDVELDLPATVIQESTRSYYVSFDPKNESKWVLRFRQSTKQGFDEDEARAAVEHDPVVSFRAFTPRPNGAATAVIILKIPNLTGVTLGPGEGRVLSVNPLPSGDVFSVDLDINSQGGAPRSRINITPEVSMVAQQSSEFRLPIRPAIQTIRNPSNNDKPSGHFNSEPQVIIRGSRLQNVVEVYFGAQQATILDRTSDVLTVLAPKGAPVETGGTRSVLVRLLTKTSINGESVTNGADFSSDRAIYTFLGDPKPPQGEKQPVTFEVKVVEQKKP